MYYIPYYLLKKITDYAKYIGIINLISNNSEFHINQVDKKLWVSNLPTIENKNKLKHIDTVISFLNNDEYGSQQTKWIDSEKIYYRIPVCDYTPPTKQDYDKLTKILNQENGNILIHCYAGKGRSNCGACIYLMHKYKLTPETAIKIIQEKIPRSNMNYWQKQSIINYKITS